LTEPSSQDSPEQKPQRLQAPDPARLAERVFETLAGDSGENEKIDHLLLLALGLVNGAGALLFIRTGTETRQAAQLISRQAESWSTDLAGECRMRAAQAIQAGKASIVPLAKMPTARIISCPVSAKDDDHACCLSVIVLLGDSPQEPFLIILQLIASILAQLLFSSGQSQLAANGPTDLLQLLLQQKDTPDVRGLCDLLKTWSGCSMLVLGSCSESNKVRLRVVSDMVKIDSRTRQSRQLIKVMQECQQHLQPILWPGKANDTGHGQSLLMKELVRSAGMQQGAAVFLPGVKKGGTVLVFLWDAEQERSGQLAEFGNTAALLGPAFYSIVSFASPKKVETSVKAMSGKKKMLVAGAVTLLLCAVAFFPKTFNLHPDTWVRPVQVQYVVARFDGIIEKVFVEPGDRVQKGASLAMLDGREIDLELRSIEADSAKALKMRDNYLAAGDIAPAQIALLEARRLKERSRLLLDRQQTLDLQSPVDGIVLSGDLKQEVGGPVGRGQLLFEIAPLEIVLVELAVLDEDVPYVAKDMEVEVHFDAFPGRTWKATVDRIAPKSEIVQGANIFLTTIELENNDRVLQPGMQGHATVKCGRRSLAWIYFHKPWYALCKLLNKLF
jgi:hypothetical protein